LSGLAIVCGPPQLQPTMASKSGIDYLLQQRGKSLKTGQELRIVLVKASGTRQQADPMDPSAPREDFPLIAKFGESTVRPNFKKMVRLHQQNVPGYKDDSGDEEAIADAPKKKRRYRRNEAPKRQWLLQEETDYLQHQISKHEMKETFKFDPNQHSTRYEGISEFNASHYILLSASASGEISLTTLAPPHAVQAFRQPAASVAMSMTEAEQAIQDSRSTMTRYMMHKKPGQPAVGNSKMRLFSKLQNMAKSLDPDIEEDDVMGDVKFETRKGGGSTKARKELLSTLGDGVSMDQEGVLGGANDQEFGGKRRFNEHQWEGDIKTGAAKGSSAGNDGMAMADDFYQRDVKAEYEELDYDANDQFDDDDVDMAEGEVQVERGGFGDEIDDEDEYEDEEDEEDTKGLASTAGLKAMLAKARGETKQEGEPETKEGEKHDDTSSTRASSPEPETSRSEQVPLAQVMAAAERSRDAAVKKDNSSKEKKVKPTGVEIDEHGQRMLSLEAVQREIWLHHGKITTKQLMKIFNIKKKSAPDRKLRFQELIKELCSILDDPVQGRMLQLKQHYATLRG